MITAVVAPLIMGLVAVQVHFRVPRALDDTTQVASIDTTAPIARLTVHPREMATGTETRQVGVTPLDGLSGYYVYVPPQCVGTTRSPLVVLLHGGGSSGLKEVKKFQELANKYGMIVLAASASQPGRWDMINGILRRKAEIRSLGNGVVSAFPKQDIHNIDTAIIQVLRTHAIDPDRIALLGFSDGGSVSLFLGRSNMNVFSRIVALDAFIHFADIGPPNPTTQFFLSAGVGMAQHVQRTLQLAKQLQSLGHPVVTQIGLRTHADYLEDEDFIWAWLRQSWSDSDTRVPVQIASDPVLTEDIVRQVTAFWSRFKWEPDSIQKTGRAQHQMQISLTIGSEQTTAVLTDLPALAAAYPSVAAILDSVGLTAIQAMTYRIAILRTGIARMAGMTSGETMDSLRTSTPFASIVPTSVLGRNLEFWNTHASAFAALESTGMWVTQ